MSSNHVHVSEFCHCHTHSDASLDGLGNVQRLVGAAKSFGFNSLAITDHGNLANSIAFSAICQQQSIKGIIGMEAYVERDGKRFHLTLLADGNRGFNTLIELNNIGQRGDDPTRPTFPLEALRTHSEGLVILTGCPASPLQATEWQDAYSIGLELKNIYGPRLMAEVMFISSQAPWERSIKLAKDLKLVPIVTNDVHFPYQHDAKSHQIVTKLRSGFSYDSSGLFLATPAELEHRVMGMAPEYLDILRTGMRNAGKLAQKLRVVKFDDSPKLPVLANADEELDRLTRSSLWDKFAGKIPKNYMERVEYELNVIKEMGFSSYFLILHDMVSFARSNKVRVGPGRGSGAGSLVLYLLGCTEMDPIEYGLSFDRFLNYKRAESPDVDIDYDSERRELVMEYARNKWGAQGVATYMRYSHKSLVHDLCRYFHVPRDLDTAASDGGVDSEEFKLICDKYHGFKEAYDAMLGQIKTIGQHAGGVTIVDETYPVPLARTTHGGLVAAWTEGEYRELSRAGIVKFDVLGLSALAVLRRLEEKHGRRAAEPVDDDPVFSLFRNGDLTGIFQFSGSQGIHDFTVKVAPRQFEDLVAINALYRPGALDSGAAQHYPEWRENPRTIHPLIDDILKPTFGVICYQEQFMEIFTRITGGDMADADLARKVLSKARPGQPDWEAKMADLQAKFFNGAKLLKLPEDVVRTIWSEIITHTRYSFNRSHSVAYARISWEMAWWKFHYTADFYAAMLSVDQAEWQRYLFEVISKGIEVVPPHVNRSTADFESDGSKIFMPLSVIKHLGSVGVEAIIKERPFTSMTDFAQRIPKKAVTARVRAALLSLGAFEGIPGTWKELGLQEEPPKMTKEESQEKYMGLILPSPDILRAIDRAKSMGYVGGVVSSREERESNWGEYTVYRLLPTGVYWSREFRELQVGDRVRLKIKSDSGKILQVYPLM